MAQRLPRAWDPLAGLKETQILGKYKEGGGGVGGKWRVMEFAGLCVEVLG